MADYSPATRAAIKAFNDRYELCGPCDADWPELCLAAAFRAYTDQVVPCEQKTPWGTVIRATKEELGIRGKLLATVAELEAHDSQQHHVMPTLIPPPLASSDWTFRITQMDTEQVESPWSCADGWSSWQSGQTFAVVEMGPVTTEARHLPMRDLIGKGFVLHDHQHLILQVFDGFPLKVRTKVWPVVAVPKPIPLTEREPGPKDCD